MRKATSPQGRLYEARTSVLATADMLSRRRHAGKPLASWHIEAFHEARAKATRYALYDEARTLDRAFGTRPDAGCILTRGGAL